MLVKLSSWCAAEHANYLTEITQLCLSEVIYVGSALQLGPRTAFYIIKCECFCSFSIKTGRARQERGRPCQLPAALCPLLVSVMGPFRKRRVWPLSVDLSSMGGTAGQAACFHLLGRLVEVVRWVPAGDGQGGRLLLARHVCLV